MLVCKIIATIFVALSVVTSLFKSAYMFFDGGEENSRLGGLISVGIYSVLWRAFVITAIWLI